MNQTAVAQEALSFFVLSEVTNGGPLQAQSSFSGAESAPKVYICLTFNSHRFSINLSLLKIKVVFSQVAKLLCFGLTRPLQRELGGVRS